MDIEVIRTWSEMLTTSFQGLLDGVISFLPNVIISIIIFIVGWVVGVQVGKWIDQLVKVLKVDRALQSLGIEELTEKAGYRLNSGVFIGGLFKWFIILAFLMAALDVLGLSQVNEFLRSILAYIPNVIVAVLILVVAALLGDLAKKVVSASAKAADVNQAHFLGEVSKWAVWIFAFFAAVNQLGIAGGFFQIIFTGLVAMLSLAGGLAFGLGGKDAAAEYISEIRRKVQR